MPKILIVAGPNGAGKTTFANEYLRADPQQYIFVNADEIAQRLPLPPHGDIRVDRYAAREMLRQIERLIAEDKDFAFETTLASLTYARKIPAWRALGYQIILIYLRLPDVKASFQRVQRRVAAGGHGIPEEVIKRRFQKSANYLETIYKPLVDEWYIWDSAEKEFRLAESSTWRS